MEGIQNFKASAYQTAGCKEKTTNEKAVKQTNKNPSIGEVIGGVMASLLVLSTTSFLNDKLGYTNKMINLNNSLTADEIAQVEKAAGDTMKNSGLEANGVSIIKASSENSDEVVNILAKDVKYLPKKLKKFYVKMDHSGLLSGENAIYSHSSKKIIMTETGLNLLVFHEAGHAMNANLSKVSKALQKCRPLGLLAVPISMIALFKTKKSPGEEPKNGLDKATTFVKDNVGKLAFASFVPLLLEEGLASIKGNKYARKFLSPDLAKKVVKTNKFSFLGYASLYTLASLGIYLGIKVKDFIASRKPVSEVK